ncbi:MAG: MoaD/ThiS family protein [Anaerolineae bacterium]|jgi:molybdopterin converting factor small subunit|nr:MoaD/ThiS family protein [Anaerolineae bacterium]
MSAEIHVRVRYYNVLRDAAQRGEETFAVAAGMTLRGLLRDVVARARPRVGEVLLLRTGEISPYTRFFWNGAVVGEADLDRTLQEGDEVHIFPAIAGG